MKTYLVTGGAGFIGSNYVLHLLSGSAAASGSALSSAAAVASDAGSVPVSGTSNVSDTANCWGENAFVEQSEAVGTPNVSNATNCFNELEDLRVINVDKLTYAGNLENLASIADDERHIFVQADICDASGMQAVFEQYQPDYVVNFAAESHVDRSISDPQIFVQTNVLGTVNLLQCARDLWLIGVDADGNDLYRSGVRYLQVSTDEVYGSLGATGFFTEDTPLDPHSPYSASKASADMLVKAFGDTYKLPINITRCSNNYGPFQFPEKLIPLVLNNALQHKSLPVYGDGLQVRDWLYVEDHCKAIQLVLQQGEQGETYNIGGHNERTNMQIVKTIIAEIAAHVDPKVTEQLITHVTDRKGHDRRYGIDPTKIGDALGWQPETSFEVGIVKTIQWYLNNRDWVEHVTSGSYVEYYKRMYS